MTAPAPAFAVSPDPCSRTFALNGAGTTDADNGAVRSTWTVPAGVTVVCFKVIGGGGGNSYLVSGNAGGSGASITGRLAVVPGQVLTLVVGAGGIGHSTDPATGGQGYGSGGDVADYPAVTAGAIHNFGASGGGGSAILAGSTPIVVAGGGGGGGNQGVYTLNANTASWTRRVVGNGGDAGANGTATVEFMTNFTGTTITTNPGSGAPGSGTAGSGATAGNVSPAPSGIVFSGATFNTGNAGTAGPSGNGGAGRYVIITNPQGYSQGTASGGGGGGYGGGGGGGASGLASRTTDDANRAVVTAGAGGGNYVAPVVTSQNIASAGNGSTARDVRAPGSITILY